MKRIITFATIISVFSWLMPLGALIKPGQEETACGGKRAFHMCSMCLGVGKIDPNPSAKPGISAASGFNENAKSSASGGDDFLPADFIQRLFDKSSKHYGLIQKFLFQSPRSSIFYPPKAQPFF